MVSWNEAAERNESVASEAFVIPRMTSSSSAWLVLGLLELGVHLGELVTVDELAGQVGRVALLLDAHLLHHLADDDLDVLVVDVDAL